MTLGHDTEAHKIAQDLRDLSDRITDVEQERERDRDAALIRNTDDQVQHVDQVGIRTSQDVYFRCASEPPPGRPSFPEETSPEAEAPTDPQPISGATGKVWISEPPEREEPEGFGFNFGFDFGGGN